MSRCVALGRPVCHRTTRRRGVVVARRSFAAGYFRYMVRWEGNDHDSGEYGIRDLEVRRGR